VLYACVKKRKLGASAASYNRPNNMTPPDSAPVLVVEDDPALREVYAEVLGTEGYPVRLAANGHEALTLLSTHGDLPCVVLLDLRMPVMDGWELVTRLRESDAWRELPIVVVAAHYKVADEARRIGAVAWLQKPVRVDRLLATVRALCVGGPYAETASA
jgi:CheY-like chemotaxis protein